MDHTTIDFMPVRLYNTLSRKIEEFAPLKGKTVNLYTCGPTVYNYAHIGNLRTYIFEDILERVLKYDGYKVKRVMNITDVGHLTSDADTGEDKMEKGARREGKTPAQIASFYTKAFLADIKALNIVVPPILAPATKFIPQQINLIKRLFKNGYAYETSQAIYFDVSKFKKYGRLSGQSLTQKMIAARKEVVSDSEKRNPADFALWFKLQGKFKNHLLHWLSPWGEGFPGWHIECSAISRNFLGQPFDIHTGGVDHIGTHHENEIAQSEAAYGKPLARYWLHGEFLLVDKGKMAKSEGNFITLKDITDRGINPLAFRYLCLQTNYRSTMNFSWKSLEAARNGLENLRKETEIIKKKSDTPTVGGSARDWDKTFRNCINSDLNASLALSTLRGMLGDKISPKIKVNLIKDFDKVLGLNLLHPQKKAKIPEKIKDLAAQREKYRRNEQFIEADRLRKEIDALGFIVEDTPEGPTIRHK